MASTDNAKTTSSQTTCPECGQYTDHVAVARAEALPQPEGDLAAWREELHQRLRDNEAAEEKS